MLPKGCDGMKHSILFDSLHKGCDGMQHSILFDSLHYPWSMQACHDQHNLTVCVAQGRCSMSRPTSSDNLCFPRSMWACQARDRLTVHAVEGKRWHDLPDVVWSCVLSKGDYGTPCSTSFDSVCCPRAMMACHARRSLIVVFVHWR